VGTYNYYCGDCDYEQEITCTYAEKPETLPCPCGGTLKKGVCLVALGSGMYHLDTRDKNKKADIMSDLRQNYGIDSIQKKNCTLEEFYKGAKADKSRIVEQMKAGEEANMRRVREQNEKNKPTASQIKKFEANYHKKNIVPRGTKGK
jgi:predicted nucleic acid-binding Zn ribbon protein